jgi:cellulose synthase/poly-beta-1,6-N-acetylglucosamine synthase-like glycosyltransferase
MKSKYDYIAFTDADAYVDINRLTNIVKTFSDESIMIF